MEITGRSAVSKKYANTQQFIDEVLRYFGTRFSSGDPFRPVHLRAIYDDEDNSTVIVVWDGQGTTTEGTTYQNTYAWFMTLSGGKVVTVPLAPRTARAIDLAIGERSEGPVFLAADGRRLDRHGAGRMVRRVARRAGITKQVGLHTLRTRSSPPRWMPGSRCGMCRKPPRTPTPPPPCATSTLGNCIRWASRIRLSGSWRPEFSLQSCGSTGFRRGSLIR
jgi:hypothetical protein